MAIQSDSWWQPKVAWRLGGSKFIVSVLRAERIVKESVTLSGRMTRDVLCAYYP